MQALQADSETWEQMLRGAGSPEHVLQMEDSIGRGEQGSLGEAAGHFLGYHAFDFWLNLALCHALLVDTSDGAASYQARLLCGTNTRRPQNGWKLACMAGCTAAPAFCCAAAL